MLFICFRKTNTYQIHPETKIKKTTRKIFIYDSLTGQFIPSKYNKKI